MAKTSPRMTRMHKAAHHLLSSAGLIAAGSLIAASFLITLLLASPSLIGTQLAAVVTSRLVSLTNEDRSDEGLGTLTVNPVLTAAAQAKANDMAEKGYFAHVSPDGRTSWSWFQDAGYAFSYAGENLAVDFSDSGDVNRAWLNSPTHRANIMNGHFTEIGIATAEGTYQGHKTVFVVQMFGTPRASGQASLASNSLPKDPTQPALATAEPSGSDVLGTSAQAPASHEKPIDTKPRASATKAGTEEGDTASAAPLSGDTHAASPEAPTASASLLASLAASPRDFLRDVYIFFAFVLAGALLLRTRMEFRLHHARHAFAVLMLMVLMGGLFAAADRTIFLAPVIGSGASL